MAPTPIELDGTTAVFAEIADVGHRRDDGGPAAAVLLNRLIPQASSPDAFRVVLAQWARVLRTTAPRRELYAQAFGDPGAYLAVAGELLSPPDPRRPRLACGAGPSPR
jgi:chromosome partitioning protein